MTAGLDPTGFVLTGDAAACGRVQVCVGVN
jgi:hypothetical protein